MIITILYIYTYVYIIFYIYIYRCFHSQQNLFCVVYTILDRLCTFRAAGLLDLPGTAAELPLRGIGSGEQAAQHQEPKPCGGVSWGDPQKMVLIVLIVMIVCREFVGFLWSIWKVFEELGSRWTLSSHKHLNGAGYWVHDSLGSRRTGVPAPNPMKFKTCKIHDECNDEWFPVDLWI